MREALAPQHRAYCAAVDFAPKAGRLVLLDMPDAAPGFYGLHAIHRSDTLPGPAAAWLIDRLRGLIKPPVLAGLPFGHVPTKVMLPVGAKVEMASSGREVFLVWGHFGH